MTNQNQNQNQSIQYDENGYDQDGYDENGYNLSGVDRNGFRDEITSGINPRGFNRLGYNRHGFNRRGYNEAGFDKNGYDEAGYDFEGFDCLGYNRNGVNQIDHGYDDYWEYIVDNYDAYDDEINFENVEFDFEEDVDDQYFNGFDENGYDRDGFDENGTTRAKINTIKDLVSKALRDDKISDEEFTLILKEKDKFEDLKMGIRRRYRVDEKKTR